MDWSVAPPPLHQKSLVQFLARAHTQAVGLIPSWGVYSRQQINVCLSHRCFSLSPAASLPLSLKSVNISSGVDKKLVKIMSVPAQNLQWLPAAFGTKYTYFHSPHSPAYLSVLFHYPTPAKLVFSPLCSLRLKHCSPRLKHCSPFFTWQAPLHPAGLQLQCHPLWGSLGRPHLFSSLALCSFPSWLTSQLEIMISSGSRGACTFLHVGKDKRSSVCAPLK